MAQVAVLDAEVADLRARLGQNPRNSSRPPSGQGLAKPAPRSLRKRCGRKPGRPKGQPGATLEMTDHPDEVVTHEPAGAPDAGAACPAPGHRDRAPPGNRPAPEQIRALVTEHRIISRRCGCGAITTGAAPAGVAAPVQYGPRLSAAAAYLWHGQFLSRDRTREAIGDLFGVTISPGAVTGMSARIAGRSPAALKAIRGALAGAPVAHFDETGFRVAGKLAWMHYVPTVPP